MRHKNRLVLIPVILVIAALAGCSKDDGVLITSGGLDEDIPGGVYGTVYDHEDETIANPVEGVLCEVYCFDCEQYIFDSGISDISGYYMCYGTPSEVNIHDGHEYEVRGFVNSQPEYISPGYTFTAPRDDYINLHPY